MSPRTMDEARAANEAARTKADADPVGMAERLAVLPWLAERLGAWPDPWDEDGDPIPPTVEGPDGKARVHPAWRASAATAHLAQVRNADRFDVPNPEGFRQQAARWAVAALADVPETPDSTTGLSLLAAAVERLPPVVRAERRSDPLLPVVQSINESPERTAGRLAFGGILDTGDTPSGQLTMFPAPEGPRVALLELTDAYGVPTMAQGRGAPLELAVYVGACILTPYDFRARRARLVTTVRELRSFLFGAKWRPRSAGGDRPGDWQRVRDAALHASGLWLPVPHPTGAPDLWRAVAVRKIPPADYDPSHLGREVIFDVELPPGASDGPPIDRAELSRLRRVSGPRFRAYLAAQSVAWRPGRTRVPHPGNRRLRVWTGNADAYPVLTAVDRRRLAFGEADAKNRTRAEQDAAWEKLPGSVILTRKASMPDGRRGWRIVPEAAAEAIRKKEVRNRGT